MQQYNNTVYAYMDTKGRAGRHLQSTMKVMKTFQLQLIFGNNCNRYLIQLLLQSKYLITDEQNLAVHY